LTIDRHGRERHRYRRLLARCRAGSTTSKCVGSRPQLAGIWTLISLSLAVRFGADERSLSHVDEAAPIRVGRRRGKTSVPLRARSVRRRGQVQMVVGDGAPGSTMLPEADVRLPTGQSSPINGRGKVVRLIDSASANPFAAPRTFPRGDASSAGGASVEHHGVAENDPRRPRRECKRPLDGRGGSPCSHVLRHGCQAVDKADQP